MLGRLALNRAIPACQNTVNLSLGYFGKMEKLPAPEVLSRAVAPIGVAFEAKNPLTYLMQDKSTGALNPEVLGEAVVSAIVECGLGKDVDLPCLSSTDTTFELPSA